MQCLQIFRDEALSLYDGSGKTNMNRQELKNEGKRRTTLNYDMDSGVFDLDFSILCNDFSYGTPFIPAPIGSVLVI